MPAAVAWMLALVAALFVFAACCRWLLRPGIRDGDLAASMMYRFIQVYARVLHRLHVEGRQFVPRRDPSGRGHRPLIVVANHTAGVDPVLVQAALPFEVRWMMAEDMRVPAFDPFWKWGRIIFVERRSKDARGIREGLRHLRANLVMGVFPEGHLERPPRRLLPFLPGVGMFVRKSGALVLPVFIDGTPQVDPAWASLARPSRACVTFLPVVDYTESDLTPQAIADDLRRRLAEAGGWPLHDHPPAQKLAHTEDRQSA